MFAANGQKTHHKYGNRFPFQKKLQEIIYFRVSVLDNLF